MADQQGQALIEKPTTIERLRMAWRQFRGKEFPEPKAHNLPLEMLFEFYHRKLNDARRAECKILVYRMDPAKAPFKSLMVLDRLPVQSAILCTDIADPANGIMPPLEWWTKADMPQPWTAAFLVRIQRTWKTQFGTRTREVCIATFEVQR